jgi:hypothetical protein
MLRFQQSGTIPTIGSFDAMVDQQNPFSDLALERAIHLRWTLRDINAKRLTLSPVKDEDLTVLTERGLVELRDGVPVLTDAGRVTID